MAAQITKRTAPRPNPIKSFVRTFKYVIHNPLRRKNIRKYLNTIVKDVQNFKMCDVRKYLKGRRTQGGTA